MNIYVYVWTTNCLWDLPIINLYVDKNITYSYIHGFNIQNGRPMLYLDGVCAKGHNSRITSNEEIQITFNSVLIS